VNATAATDQYGVAAYENLKPGPYTVWLSPLTEDISKAHCLPAKHFRDFTLSAGEVAYVPFLLPRAPKRLRLQIFHLHVPRAKRSFTLQLTSERRESLRAAILGVTDDGGILEKEVNANSTNAVIVIGPDEQTIEVSHYPAQISDLSLSPAPFPRASSKTIPPTDHPDLLLVHRMVLLKRIR
jgi:hypothetical protein